MRDKDVFNQINVIRQTKMSKLSKLLKKRLISQDELDVFVKVMLILSKHKILKKTKKKLTG